MKQLIHRISQTFWRIENKIAFYPSLMAISGICFALIMVYLEQRGVSAYLQKAVPWLVINDLETARTLLSTLIAGLISILVFSFSMVMIILNQASSNFSPRLLPGLISNKKHQSILGIHLAGIFYCIITLITIEPTQSSYQLPGFSVLLAILFVTVSLGSFIYFIHSISQSIQVDYILKTTFKNAKKRIEHLIQLEQDNEIVDAGLGRFDKSSDWHDYYVPQSGYIQTINTTRLLKLAQQHETHIQVIPTKNTFLLAGLPIFKSETELDEEVAKEFLNQFLIDNSESLSENYSLAFQLITEIAIKAMSPGINDPGTALTCIDYLTELLTLRLKKSDELYLVQDKQVVIEINIIHFEKLLYVILAPFRAYCSHDIVIVSKLLRMCEYLLLQDCIKDDYKTTIKKQANEIINDAREKLQNALDLDVLDTHLSQFE
jgi:uncharacterized membrane protein